jgi:Cdc6-like AAA superfamily ATPase
MANKGRKLTDEDWDALRWDIGQLFTPSTPIKVGDLLAGRRNELRAMLDAIAERGRHLMIYGEPGVGKTSAAQTLQYFIPTKTSKVRYIRKPAFSSDTFSSIWMEIFREMRFSVETNGITETHRVSDLYSDGVTPGDVVRELNYFSENDIPIIVIDEFNLVRDKDSSRQMAETIKAVSDASINATIVVVGISDTVENLIEGHESIKRSTEEILMPRMKGSELDTLLVSRFSQAGMQIIGDAKWKIINLTKGLPAFAHSLGRDAAVAAIDERSLDISEAHVDIAIEKIVQSSQNSLKNDYEVAVLSNQVKARFRQILTACAMAKSDERGYFTPKQVQGPLADILKKSVGIDSFNPNLKELASDKRGNVLEQIGSERFYRYRFSDPAMQPYVIMKGIKDGHLSEGAMTALSSPEQGDLFANAT